MILVCIFFVGLVALGWLFRLIDKAVRGPVSEVTFADYRGRDECTARIVLAYETAQLAA